jgi:hypothetical protein
LDKKKLADISLSTNFLRYKECHQNSALKYQCFPKDNIERITCKILKPLIGGLNPNRRKLCPAIGQGEPPMTSGQRQLQRGCLGIPGFGFCRFTIGHLDLFTAAALFDLDGYG